MEKFNTYSAPVWFGLGANLVFWGFIGLVGTHLHYAWIAVVAGAVFLAYYFLVAKKARARMM